MKTVLTSILLCVFLQVVWVSLSTQAAEAGEDPCNEYKDNNSSCCADVANDCGFFKCNESFSVCAKNSTGICDGEDRIENSTCAVEPTVTDPCSNYSTIDACCQETAKNCGFFTCKDNSKVCAQNNATAGICSGEGPTGNSTCAAPDVCESFTNQTACCDAAESDSCAFYKCTTSDTVTVCRSNATEKGSICPESGEEAVQIPCSDTPTTSTTTTATTTTTTTGGKTSNTQGTTTNTPSPTSTKASSTGGGGRKFDGASFIGGIVLCAGLFAIAYFGLKFYKSRQERNYHTL